MLLLVCCLTTAVSPALLSGCTVPITPLAPTVEFQSTVDATPSVVVSLASATPAQPATTLEMGPSYGPIGAVLAVSRDSRRLAIQQRPEGGRSNVVSLFDITSGEHQIDLAVPVAPVTGLKAMDFSPDGALLAAGGLEQTVFVWDVGDERIVAELPFGDAIVDVRFSGDGRALVASSAGESAHVTIWSVGSWVADQELSSATTSLASIAGDSSIAMGNLVFGSGGYAVTLVNVMSREIRGIFELPASSNRIYAGEVADVALSADRKFVAIIIDDEVRTWDLVANKELYSPEAEWPHKPIQIEYSSPGWWIILDDSDTISIVDVRTDRLVLSQTLNGVRAFAVLPDGSGFVSGSQSEPVHLWRFVR